MSRFLLVAGALNMALAVGMGAFGAHGLKERVSPDLLAVYNTGAQYHIYHALGLVLLGLLAGLYPSSPLLRSAGITMLVGIVLFSGSLYILALSGIRALGAITPLGGVAFIAAWILTAVAVIKSSAG